MSLNYFLETYSSQINPLLHGVTKESVEKNGHEGCFCLENAYFSYISPYQIGEILFITFMPRFIEELGTVTPVL